jgi:DNA primase
MAGEPVLCFDGDQAGLKAAWRVADMALPLIQPGRTVRFALLPEGKDPDDLVRADGADAFRAVLSEARPLADLLWTRETSGGVFGTPERRAELEKTLRELAGRIRDESVRYHYQQEMRERVHAFFGAQRQRTTKPGERSRGQTAGQGGQWARGQAAGKTVITESLGRSAIVKRISGPMPLREAAIVVALFNHSQLLDEHWEEISALEFDHRDLRQLHTVLIDYAAHGKSHDRNVILGAATEAGLSDQLEQAVSLARRMRVWPVLQDAAFDDANETFSQMLAMHSRSKKLKQQKATLEAELREAIDSDSEVGHLLSALNTVSSELASLERLDALVDGFGVSSGRAIG